MTQILPARILNRRLVIFLCGHGLTMALLMARDLGAAFIWGASPPMGEFMATLILPVIIMSIAGYSISGVLLSTYLKLKMHAGEEKVKAALNHLCACMIAFFSLAFLLSWLLNFQQSTAAGLALYGLFFSLSTVPRTVLVSEKHDRAVLFAPACALTLGLIAMALTFPILGIQALVLAYVIHAGGELILLWMALSLRGTTLIPRFSQGINSKVFLSEFSYVAGASILMSLAIAFDQFVAGTLSSVALPHFNFATKLPSMAAGFVTAFFAIYLYPRIAAYISEANRPALIKTLVEFAKLNFLIVLPACLMIAWGAELIVQNLFERGAFLAKDTFAVAEVLKFLILQLPTYFICLVAMQVLIALGKANWVFHSGLLTLALKFAATLYLSSILGVAGIGLANSLVQLVIAFVMVGLVMRKLRVR